MRSQEEENKKGKPILLWKIETLVHWGLFRNCIELLCRTHFRITLLRHKSGGALINWLLILFPQRLPIGH